MKTYLQYRIVCDQKYTEGKTKEKEDARGEVRFFFV